ncbi:MAG: hydroxymethylglutaryl-CoA lyase [Saprospiraceae bacterium]|nr:hydroxymethylglutaryl-CoA lyase [Saprospiraceae bacterium]
MLKLIECPRDAMQGVKELIPTQTKINYINQLLKVGFDTIDFGSFVSPKAIPQMADTHEVIKSLDLAGTKSKLLAIVANKRGADDAVKYSMIDYIGYPFSISETFQMRNTNSTIAESIETVKDIQAICADANKKLVIYISMGFGNPYGDPWNFQIAQKWVDELADLGIRIISLSDTIGVSTPDSIDYLFSNLIPPYPDVEFGAHLHTTPNTWKEKIEAAWKGGCKRFDGAFRGHGGCPMAKDELTGNMPMEKMIYYFDDLSVDMNIDWKELRKAVNMTDAIFLH